MAQGGETRGGITPQNALAVLAYVAEAFPQARDIETRFLQQGMHPEHAPLLQEDPEQEQEGDRGMTSWLAHSSNKSLNNTCKTSV